MPTGLQEPKKRGFQISFATDFYSCCSQVSPPLIYTSELILCSRIFRRPALLISRRVGLGTRTWKALPKPGMAPGIVSVPGQFHQGEVA